MPTLNAQSNGWVRYQLTAVDASGTNNSEAIDLAAFQQVSVQVVHASHDDTSTWELQVSNDGTNYDTLTGSSTTTASASGSASVEVEPWQYRLLRVSVTEADGNASATLTPHIVAKRKG
jgi:hypothetical protein